MKLDTEIKELWLAALRSGDYKQGSSYLWNPLENTFCCLGVLACATGIMEESGEVRIDGGAGYFSRLPYEVLDLIGLGYTAQNTLIQMNDKCAKTFDQIADYIEESL